MWVGRYAAPACCSAAFSASNFGQPHFLAHQATNGGTMMAVMTTAAAIWVVALATYGCQLGSIRATAAGVAMVLPAAEAMAAPA